MHLVFVGTDLAPLEPQAGALERVVVAWAEHMAQVGRVTLVSRQPLTSRARVATLVARSEEELARTLGELAPDLTIFNNRPLWGELAAGAAAHVMHNFPTAWQVEDFGALPNVVRGHHMFAVSRALADEVARVCDLDPHAVGVVPIPVEPLFFKQTREVDKSLVLFPNRLLRKKGVQVATEAARLLRTSDLRFVFFDYLSPWAEPTAEHLEMRALVRSSPNCELVAPPSTREAVAQWFGRAAVAVCPSVEPEGFGLVALEAQASGTPLVTSDAGGLAEAVWRPNLTVAAGDAEALGEAILASLDRFDTDGPRQKALDYRPEVAGRQFSAQIRARLR